MLRRKFFRWISSAVLSLFVPGFSRGQANGLQPTETSLLGNVAAVVLPSTLGPGKTEQICEKFVAWTRGYKAGADAGYGYGFPKPQKLPANPATNYGEQLQQLEAVAAGRGSTFSKLDAATQRELIASALTAAQIDRIPPRPSGKHVVADLLSFFYNSAEGQDFLYNAAIQRDDCRGLETSAQRAARLS